MSTPWKSVIGLWVIGMGLVINAPAAAQVTSSANGPYYATPSWDQKIATGRFVVLSNWNGDAVLDRETGLVWEKSPSGPASQFFIDAHLHCFNLNTGGRTGWRLPLLPELMSLVDRSQSSPSLPSGHPFTVELQPYWTATNFYAGTAGSFVNFADGTASLSPGGGTWHTWCVRGGSGVDTLIPF